MEALDITKCNCLKSPFEPPKGCFHYCIVNILRFAKPDDMESNLKIRQSLADKIYELTSNERLIMWSDFKSYLTKEEFEEVEFLFRNLDHKGKKWIKKKLKEQGKIPVPA